MLFVHPPPADYTKARGGMNLTVRRRVTCTDRK